MARTFSAAIAFAVAALTIALGAPAASAVCLPTPDGSCGSYARTAPLNLTNPSATYKGWAYTRGRGICPANVTCIWAGEIKVPAWRWSSATRSWVATTRPTGERVYVWPYSGIWRWTWTADRGWLAMTSDRIVLKSDPCWDYTTWQFACAVPMVMPL